MPTISSDLDWCQGMLGDALQIGMDGQLWDRAELLRLYNDGYRALLQQSQAVRRWVCLDVPPRYTMTGTAEWEERSAGGGTWWCFAWQARGYACTQSWEAQVLEGVTPDGYGGGVSQEWERAWYNPQNLPYRFALPKDGSRIHALYYDHRRLGVSQMFELDQLWTDWRSLGDYPLTWTRGTGRSGTFEVYEIVTFYTQAYQHKDGPWGLPRTFSGTRAYGEAVTSTHFGIARHLDSPERQYLATMGVWGIPRAWGSSVQAVQVLEVVGPDLPDLLEGDTPTLIPPQMQRYLRFYVLAMAWAGQGEGHNPALSAVCTQLFVRGVGQLRALVWLTRRDAHLARLPQGAGTGGRPPLVRLPSHYPRVTR